MAKQGSQLDNSLWLLQHLAGDFLIIVVAVTTMVLIAFLLVREWGRSSVGKSSGLLNRRS